MKICLILLLSTLLGSTLCECWLTNEYQTTSYHNFYATLKMTLQSAKDFYEYCSWFDIKEAYYWTKENHKAELMAKLERSLIVLAEQRKEIILNALSFNFGSDCRRLDDETKLSNGAFNHYSLVEMYFSGQKFFVECEDYAYLLNSFGSTTVTSDFDYSVYRLNLNGKMPTLMQEIDAVKQISKGLYFLEMEIELNVCGGTLAPDCLDSNGYPEIMVLYYTHFYPSVALIEYKDGRKLDSTRFSNLMSAKFLRYCVVGPVYFAKIAQLKFQVKKIGFEVNAMVESCYDALIKAKEKYRKSMGVNVEHKDTSFERTIKTPYPKSNVHGNRMMYIVGNNQANKRSLRKMVDYFAGKGNFTECISHIDQPLHYLYKGKAHRNPTRIIQRNNVEYTVYNDMFYIPSTYSLRKVEYTNQILLPFLGACHIWATEAYVTFGALHFVKKEKLILSNRYIMRCDCNIETFVENMGIMIYHLVEMGKHKNLMNSRVDKLQSISDTFSKYLRRSMLGATLPCYSDFDTRISQLFVRDETTRKIEKSSRIYRFYNMIKGVNQDRKDKKDVYYHYFKQYFAKAILKNLIDLSIEFFRQMHAHVFQNYNIGQLYKPRKNLM